MEKTYIFLQQWSVIMLLVAEGENLTNSYEHLLKLCVRYMFIGVFFDSARDRLKKLKWGEQKFMKNQNIVTFVLL
jgi:hypothetical protein